MGVRRMFFASRKPSTSRSCRKAMMPQEREGGSSREPNSRRKISDLREGDIETYSRVVSRPKSNSAEGKGGETPALAGTLPYVSSLREIDGTEPLISFVLLLYQYGTFSVLSRSDRSGAQTKGKDICRGHGSWLRKRLFGSLSSVSASAAIKPPPLKRSPRALISRGSPSIPTSRIKKHCCRR